MADTPVADSSFFRDALRALHGVRTHGDILAFFLALKFHQGRMPVVGDGGSAMPAGRLEDLLDDFYEKPNAAAGQPGPVCMIFNERFRPRSSYDNNNWRDFFRYGNGVACLASENLLATSFVAEERQFCRHLVTNSRGDPACVLHPKQTRYIRGLGKPKLLRWDLRAHAYKVVNLDEPRLIEAMKGISSSVPLESLMVALYHDARWSTATSVPIEQFARDFHFHDVATVEYLFSVEPVDPALRKRVAERTVAIHALKRRPFVMVEPRTTSLSLVELRERDVAFRNLVRTAYDNACAVCGLRVRAGIESWEVQAAHIYPHHLGGTDDVRNGIALCRSHHWAFDEHVFKIERDYSIVWGRNAPAEWRRYTVLRLPDDATEHPDQGQALEWHRSKFRR